MKICVKSIPLRWFAYLLIPIMFASCACPPKGGGPTSKKPPYDRPAGVSLISLIAHPDDYAGMKIRLIGYYSFAFEESALYLTREDWLIQNYDNSIWLNIPFKFTKPSIALLPDPMPRTGWQGYIRVIGRFKYNPKKGVGHMGLWLAELDDIKTFEEIKIAK